MAAQGHRASHRQDKGSNLGLIPEISYIATDSYIFSSFPSAIL